MKKSFFCLQLVIIAASVILTRQSLPYDSVWDVVLSNFPEELNSPKKLDLFSNNLSKQQVNSIYFFYIFTDKLLFISPTSNPDWINISAIRKESCSRRWNVDTMWVLWTEGKEFSAVSKVASKWINSSIS